MKKIIFFGTALFVVAGAVAQKNPKTTVKLTTTSSVKSVSGVPIKSLLDSFSYQAGYNVGSNMLQQGITEVNAALIKKGIEDFFAKRTPAIDQKIGNQSLNRQLEKFNNNEIAAEKAKADAVRATGAVFMEKNKKVDGVITLPNGIQYKVIKDGDSIAHKPKASDTVVVNYVGTLVNGTEFDNSYKRGKPAVFPINVVIRGWAEILQLMRVGSNWKVWIPNDLAYGDNPPPNTGINPGDMLIFEMSLEGIKPQTTE